MKRLIYISTLLFLVACSSEDIPSYVDIPYSDTPILLDVASAASTEASTRAAMKGNNHIGPWVSGDQFLVNAYYYYSPTTTLAQQFMKDVPVEATITTNSWNNSTTTSWDYTPTKYWPQQGYVDYFAMYPVAYNANIDRQRLYHENMQDTVIATRFYLSSPMGEQSDNTWQDATRQYDLMFSHRPHLSKPDVTTPVKFHFTHAEMAVRFQTWRADIGSHIILKIEDISLNNIHTGGRLTAYDDTDWQQYYAEFSTPGATSTAGATTPVKLRYEWDWHSGDPLAPDVRDTYRQTVDFTWIGFDDQGNWISNNPDDKIFIIPPQCFDDGQSITVRYSLTTLKGDVTNHEDTFTVDACGEPGKVLNIVLSIDRDSSTQDFEIEVITATLTPWEDVTGSLSTDLEQ